MAIKIAVVIVLCVAIGSLNLVFKKLQNQSLVPAEDGTTEPFDKPWLQTAFVFVGECFSLVIWRILARRHDTAKFETSAERMQEGSKASPESSQRSIKIQQPVQHETDDEPTVVEGIPDEDGLPDRERTSSFELVDLTSPQQPEGAKKQTSNGASCASCCEQVKRRTWWLILLVPTVFDIASVALTSMALIYLSASLMSALRGFLVIFTGVLSRIFLKRRLHKYQWIGLGLTVVGLAIMGTGFIVGVQDYAINTGGAATGSAQQVAIAFGLAVLGMLASAMQYIAEESFLKKRQLHPAFVNGMEGVFGMLIVWCALLPILQYSAGSDHGSYESFWDGFYNLTHSPTLATFLALQIACVPFYNILALQITKDLSAVHRTLVDNLRIASVWIAGLVIFYGVDSRYGEQWTNDCYIEAVGLLFVVIGMLAYSRAFKLPYVAYPTSSTAGSATATPHSAQQRGSSRVN